MTHMDHIYETSLSQLQPVPTGIAIVAEPRYLSGLSQFSGQFHLIPLDVGEPLPVASLRDAQIVIVQIEPSNDMQLVDRLRSELPSVGIIAAMTEINLDVSRALMRRGVADLVELPFAIDEVLSAISDLGSRLAQQRGTDAKLAPMVAVMKSAGGSGATTIATHLASFLSGAFSDTARACLIDCDLQSGDAAAYLGCTQRLGLMDLIEAQADIDEELLRSVICHGAGNVDVVSAPQDILPIEAIDFHKLSAIMSLARQQYPCVVVDCPAAMTNWSLSLAFAANRIVLVTTLAIPALRHTRRQIDFLKSMGLPADRILVVLNRVEKKLFRSIDESDASRALGHPVFASIAAEGEALAQAQDEGVLFNETQRRTRLEKSFDSIASRLHAELSGGE